MIQMAADNTSEDSGSSLVGDESLLFISEKSVPFVQGPYRGGLYFSLHGISPNVSRVLRCQSSSNGRAPSASPARTTYIAMFGPLVVQSLCPLLPPTAHNCRT